MSEQQNEAPKRDWSTPRLTELDVRETAAGSGASDGMGGGSVGSGNRSGS